MANILQTENSKIGGEVEQAEFSYTAGGKWHNHFGKLLGNVSDSQLYDPTIPLLQIYIRERKIYVH